MDEIKPSPGKGLGVFETRLIQRGERILSEAVILSQTQEEEERMRSNTATAVPGIKRDYDKTFFYHAHSPQLTGLLYFDHLLGGVRQPGRSVVSLRRQPRAEYAKRNAASLFGEDANVSLTSIRSYPLAHDITAEDHVKAMAKKVAE
ncbi:hypothetical protein F5Y06DRAFT_300677 [Hypoxylon sp. FL0890]|nr:hypothetical protein F5Y06DRAFT_300677 [Hypoxylon sp. FL0890]